MLTSSNGMRPASAFASPNDTAILVEGVSVRYRMPTERITTLKEQVIRTVTRRAVKYNEFWALRNVNLQVRRGEGVALIGRNGAGKSTLLKVIARATKPSNGRVVVIGKVAPIIELGAGFHQELTGRENVFLNGAMLGFSKAEMLRKFDNIVQFSELEAFVDSPIRTYSSGMVARLAFSIAAEADPDVLIIDEVLSVGDEAFRNKCMERMQRFRQRGVTILFVTHSVDDAKKICERAVWVDQGRLRYVGETQHVIDIYRESLEYDADLATTQKLQVVRVPRQSK